MNNKSAKKSLFSKAKFAFVAFLMLAAMIAGGVASSDSADTPDAQETEVAWGMWGASTGLSWY